MIVKYASPHPKLTTRFVRSEDPQVEDDSIALLNEAGEEMASVGIMSAFIYGGAKDAYTATVETTQDGEIAFWMGQERATFDEAAADAVARLIKDGKLEA